MFEVSDKAGEMMTQYFQDKDEDPYVRIILNEGGWAGPALGMVLDEPRDDDEIVKKNGNTFMISKELLEKVQPISVDYIDSEMGSGYTISSSLSSDGGGCGGSCSCWVGKKEVLVNGW